MGLIQMWKVHREKIVETKRRGMYQVSSSTNKPCELLRHVWRTWRQPRRRYLHTWARDVLEKLQLQKQLGWLLVWIASSILWLLFSVFMPSCNFVIDTFSWLSALHDFSSLLTAFAFSTRLFHIFRAFVSVALMMFSSPEKVLIKESECHSSFFTLSPFLLH